MTDDVKIKVGSEESESSEGIFAALKDSLKELSEEAIDLGRDVAKGAALGEASLLHLKEFALEKLLGPVSLLLVKLEGVHVLMEMFAKNTEQAAEGLKEFSSVEQMETQFRSLLKTASEAKERVAEVREKAEASPFKVEDVGSASKMLQLMTHGQLASGSGLEQVIELAARTGNQLTPVADAIGHLYQVIEAGQPLGRAARQMESLGLMTEQERLSLEKLQQSGRSAGDVWEEFAKKTLAAVGASALQAQTLQSLNDKLDEARKEASRQVGDVYEKEAKANVQATTEMAKAMAPLTAEAAKVKEAFGMAAMPTQTFPVFDTQIKQVITRVLQMKEVWTTVIRGMGIGFTAIVGGAIVLTVKHFEKWISIARAAEKAALKWAKTNVVVAASEWTTTKGIQANTAALLENNAVGLRANAILLARAAVVGIFKNALSALTTVVLQAVRAMISLPGAAIAAAAVMVLAYQRAREQIKVMAEMRDAILAAQDLSRKERESLVSTTDKVQALTNQYQRLADARKKAAEATDPFQKSIALQGLGIAMKEYVATAAQTVQANGEPLRPGPERQNLLDQMGEMQEHQLERDLPLRDQILHAENQRVELAAKRADLQKKADEAAKAAAPDRAKTLIGEQVELQRQIDASRALEDSLPKTPRRHASNPLMDKIHAQEQAKQAQWQQRVDAIEGQLAGLPGAAQASEAAQVDLTQNSLQDTTAKDKLGELKSRLSRQDFETRQAQEEAEAEQRILDLKTRGFQRTMDEAHIRQELLGTKQKEIEADKERLAVVQPKIEAAEQQARDAYAAIPKDATPDERARAETDIRTKLAETLEAIKQDGGVIYTQEEQTTKLAETRTGLLEQQKSINETLIAQQDEMLNQEERRQSRLMGLIGRLPHGLQKPLLEQVPDRLESQAKDYEARAQKARDAGDTTAADQWQDRAEQARDQMAQIQDELRTWSTHPSILQSEAHRLGQGGRMVNYGARGAGLGTGINDDGTLAGIAIGAHALGGSALGGGLPRKLLGAAPDWVQPGGHKPIISQGHAPHGMDLIAERISEGNKTLVQIAGLMEKGQHGGQLNPDKPKVGEIWFK